MKIPDHHARGCRTRDQFGDIEFDLQMLWLTRYISGAHSIARAKDMAAATIRVRDPANIRFPSWKPLSVPQSLLATADELIE